jgi:hypothetical protein
MRSILSVIPSFRETLENSRVYKRMRRRGRDSESIVTLGSSERGCSWSMLSDLSLGELSIADIWVIELPICLSDLWDPEPFRVDSTSITTVSAPRRSSSRLNWSTKGRIHNAIAAGNDYVVRTLLTMGSDRCVLGVQGPAQGHPQHPRPPLRCEKKLHFEVPDRTGCTGGEEAGCLN